MFIIVTVLNPKEVIFEGKASRITVPGEMGVFEVLPFHKSLISRLISGTLLVDDRAIDLKRGIIKVKENSVTAIIEEN